MATKRAPGLPAPGPLADDRQSDDRFASLAWRHADRAHPLELLRRETATLPTN
jgi:hypothetical protein